MKNDSVKVKRTAVISSTTSVISDFSVDCSPMPNGNILYQSFSHAQSIQARLSRNSLINEDNIKYSQPKCNPKQSYIELDEVLAKSPLARYTEIGQQNNFSDAVKHDKRYTKETLKRISRLETFIAKYQQSKIPQIDVEQTTPKVSENRYDHLIQPIIITTEDDEQNRKYNRKLSTMLDNIRLLRKQNPIHFQTYNGNYALTRSSNSFFVPYGLERNGVVVCSGSYLESMILEGNTFRVNAICQNPEKCNFTTLCLPDKHFNDWIIAGTELGTILSWQALNGSYAIQPDVVYRSERRSTYLTQRLQSIYVGTLENDLIILDQRLKEKKCFTLAGNQVMEVATFQQKVGPVVGSGMEFDSSSSFDSPKASRPHIDYFRESNFEQQIIEEEPDSAIIQVEGGIKYIDVLDTNVLLTLKNGFSCFDLRNPTSPLLSYQQPNVKSVKALFSHSNNIIFADACSHNLQVWNIDQGEIIFNKDMPQNPVDLISAPETRELVALFHDGPHSLIMVYDNGHAKPRFLDELTMESFHIRKLQLDSTGQTLYGFGPYSLRTWKYHCPREVAMLQNKVRSMIS